jgi:hypothetical protein
MEADLLDGVGDVGGLDSMETLTYVSIGVETSLQSTMPARSRISRVN